MSPLEHGMAAEQHVLGVVMLWPENIDEVALTPDDFRDRAHATIWRKILAMRDASEAVDVITVAEALNADNALETVGGLRYLTDMTEAAFSPANVEAYAAIVRDQAQRRRLVEVLRLIHADLQTGADVGDVVEDAQARIMAIGESSAMLKPRAVSDIAAERIQVLDERYNGNDDGRETGLIDLDEKLGKVRPGDMLVIAGRPSMGKSSFAMQLGEAMSTPSAPCLFFSLEMSAGQLVDRMMASAGRVNLKKFRSANFQDEDWTGLTAALGRMGETPVYIDDHSHALGQILATMRAFKRRHGLGVVVIDYIGLAGSDGDTREQEVARITRGLKLAAKQLRVPILALSQLNRKLEDRADKRPMMSDLRESGAIEQDADMVLMLYRDEVYYPDTPNRGVCEVIIRKNRHGEANVTVPTVFRADIVRFENFAGHYLPTAHNRKKISRIENDL
jgi:replicative DNA helicase